VGTESRDKFTAISQGHADSPGHGPGDAFVTLASGADALFWNPAGLTGATSHNIAMTMTVWLFDTKQGAFGYALPLDDIGTFGLQVQYVDFGTIRETRVDQLQFVGPAGISATIPVSPETHSGRSLISSDSRTDGR